jgi:hypothetical protein
MTPTFGHGMFAGGMTNSRNIMRIKKIVECLILSIPDEDMGEYASETRHRL